MYLRLNTESSYFEIKALIVSNLHAKTATPDSGSGATYTTADTPTNSTPDTTEEWFRLTYNMVAMLPLAQDEGGECDVITQNRDVVKVQFSIDYYSMFRLFSLLTL